MRVLFATGGGHLPQMMGGLQSSMHQLLLRTRAAGHEAAVICALHAGGWTEIRSRVERRLTRRRYSMDTQLGYPVYRGWFPTDATEVVKRFRPDVAVVQQGHHTVALARSLTECGVSVIVYFRNAELNELDGDLSELKGAHYIANSEFTARKYRQAFGVTSTVIPPLVETSIYSTPTSKENVTYINPSPLKGLDVALGVAKLCPDIPFSFVESWSIDPQQRTDLAQRLSALPNVTLRPRTNDMKSVYNRARILLAPSQWEEAWGRVASEAHCSGIPVLGSNRGGLPEAIGSGGIILPHDAPPQDWAAALRQMWDDPTRYAELSAAAKSFSTRPAMNPDNQFADFLAVVERAARRDQAA